MRMRSHQQPGERPRPTRRSVKILLWSMVAVLVIVACTALMYLLMQQPVSQLETLVDRVRRWKLAGVVVQTLVVVATVAGWPSVVAWCRRQGVIQEHEVAPVVAARWKVATMLGIYLVLVAMGPVELVRLAGSLFQAG